jgi:hypothetical protein
MRLSVGHLHAPADPSAGEFRRAGSPWQDMPGEYREPAPADRHPGRYGAASVEQQRHLWDLHLSVALISAYQVNVGEGRHLWAMVYLLRALGRDGRDEARRALERRSGDSDNRVSSARSTNRRRTGCRSSCSRSSPIATANTSFARLPSRDSIHVAHLPLHADRGSITWHRRIGHLAHRAAHVRSDGCVRRDPATLRAGCHRPANYSATSTGTSA